jgi:hypothetical protein
MPTRLYGWRLAVIAASLCAAAQTAAAQPKPRHTGFTMAFGFGQGVVKSSCETCNYIPNERANLFGIRAGWTLHDLVLLAAEGTFVSRTVANGRERDRPIETSYQAYTASGILYLGKHSDAFVKLGGGIGMGKRWVQLSTDTLRSYVETTNPVVRFGTGIDLRIGRTWSVTPTFEYIVSTARTSDEISFVPLDNRSQAGVKAKNNLMIFALALTFH